MHATRRYAATHRKLVVLSVVIHVGFVRMLSVHPGQLATLQVCTPCMRRESCLTFRRANMKTQPLLASAPLFVPRCTTGRAHTFQSGGTLSLAGRSTADSHSARPNPTASHKRPLRGACTSGSLFHDTWPHHHHHDDEAVTALPAATSTTPPCGSSGQVVMEALFEANSVPWVTNPGSDSPVASYDRCGRGASGSQLGPPWAKHQYMSCDDFASGSQRSSGAHAWAATSTFALAAAMPDRPSHLRSPHRRVRSFLYRSCAGAAPTNSGATSPSGIHLRSLITCPSLSRDVLSQAAGASRMVAFASSLRTAPGLMPAMGAVGSLRAGSTLSCCSAPRSLQHDLPTGNWSSCTMGPAHVKDSDNTAIFSDCSAGKMESYQGQQQQQELVNGARSGAATPCYLAPTTRPPVLARPQARFSRQSAPELQLMTAPAAQAEVRVHDPASTPERHSDAKGINGFTARLEPAQPPRGSEGGPGPAAPQNQQAPVQQADACVAAGAPLPMRPATVELRVAVDREGIVPERLQMAGGGRCSAASHRGEGSGGSGGPAQHRAAPECWHEVWATRVVDPVTQEDAVLLVQVGYEGLKPGPGGWCCCPDRCCVPWRFRICGNLR